MWDGFTHTEQKMKFSIKDFFSKCDQIRRKLRIWSHLLNKSLMENFIFYAVSYELVINCFWGIDDRQKALSLISSRNYCQILTITYLRHLDRRILTCADPAFGIIWMKLCSIDNHYTCSNFTHQAVDLLCNFEFGEIFLNSLASKPESVRFIANKFI